MTGIHKLRNITLEQKYVHSDHSATGEERGDKMCNSFNFCKCLITDQQDWYTDNNYIVIF